MILILHIRKTRSTTHLYLRNPIRIRTELITFNHLKRGIDIFQCLQYIHITHLCQILGLYGSSSPGVTFCFSSKNTSNHNLLHFRYGRGQRHVNLTLSLISNFLCLHADKRKNKNHIFREGYRQGIFPVYIRRSSQRGSLDHNGNSR